MNLVKEYEEARFKLELYDNNILHIKWNSANVDYAFIDDLTKKRLEISKGLEIKMISDISSVKSGTKEARKRLTDKEGLIGLKALAIVCKSRVQQTLVQLIMTVFKSNIETKVFKNNEEAFNWLINYDNN